VDSHTIISFLPLNNNLSGQFPAMSATCILTDSTACFTRVSYSGQEHVYLIPCSLQAGGHTITDGQDLSLLGQFSVDILTPPLRAFAPSIESFQSMYHTLGQTYQNIIVILMSSHLSPAIEHALLAAQVPKSPAAIHIIDSQTSAVGLGFLVHTAAEALQRGIPPAEITRLIRGLTRHIYAVFCLPDLSYLARAGQLDPAQAVIGEMLGMLPLFIMENGSLVHTYKIRSPRHMVDIMFEFIAEFEHLRHLALLQGLPFFDQESRNIRERIHQNIRAVPFSEHILPLSLATMLGPRAIGLMAIESGF
jgi:DegV family protein with EDD domain